MLRIEMVIHVFMVGNGGQTTKTDWEPAANAGGQGAEAEVLATARLQAAADVRRIRQVEKTQRKGKASNELRWIMVFCT